MNDYLKTISHQTLVKSINNNLYVIKASYTEKIKSFFKFKILKCKTKLNKAHILLQKLKRKYFF